MGFGKEMVEPTELFSSQRILTAKLAHEVNRAYCASMGDYSQPAWERAPEWQRTSCLIGVTAHLNNPEMTPEQSHEIWLAFKEKEGWVYGQIKDPEAKTHPCVLPYDQLPVEQRTKDYLFKAICEVMARQIT